MTATAHAILGTVIAAKIGNPIFAVPIALASHFAADLIPHWDVGTNRHKKTKKKLIIESASDVLLSFVVSYGIIFFIFPQTDFFYAFLILIIAQLPDWLMAPYYFFGIREFKWAYLIGKNINKDLDLPWGLINQIAILAAVVYLAKNL